MYPLIGDELSACLWERTQAKKAGLTGRIQVSEGACQIVRIIHDCPKEDSLSTDTRIAFVIPLSGWLLVVSVMICAVKDLGFWDGMAGAFLVILSLMIHELAHVFVARAFDVRVYEIGIKFIGAYTRRQSARCRLQELAISAAGPSATVLLFLGLFFVPRIGPWLSAWNFAIAVLNLLPLSGTDGRRILTTIFRPTSVEAPKMADALRLVQ
jgi:Zn-dependent protease